MATVGTVNGVWLARGARQVTWAGVTNGNTSPVDVDPVVQPTSISVSGTFGVGGSVSLEGSDDGVNWVIVNDLTGAAITFTVAGSKTIRDFYPQLRLHVTAGDGTTSLGGVMHRRQTYV